MTEIPWSVGQLVAGPWMPRAGEGKAEERQKREGSSWLPGDPQVSLPLSRSSSAQICPPAPQAVRALTLTAGPGPGEPGAGSRLCALLHRTVLGFKWEGHGAAACSHKALCSALQQAPG